MSSNTQVLPTPPQTNSLRCGCGKMNAIKRESDKSFYSCECGYSALVFGHAMNKELLAGYGRIKVESR